MFFERRYITRTLCLFVHIALLTTVGPALAQQQGKQQAKQQGQVGAEEDAWTYRCSQSKDKSKVCEIAQRLSVKKTGQRVVEIAIGRIGENKQKLRAVLVLPLGVSTQAGVSMRVDDSDKTYSANISHCLEDGCYVYMDITDELLASMKKGRAARLAMRTHEGRKIRVNLSLTGFTKAYAKLMDHSEARKYLEAEGRDNR